MHKIIHCKHQNKLLVLNIFVGLFHIELDMPSRSRKTWNFRIMWSFTAWTSTGVPWEVRVELAALPQDQV